MRIIARFGRINSKILKELRNRMIAKVFGIIISGMLTSNSPPKWNSLVYEFLGPIITHKGVMLLGKLVTMNTINDSPHCTLPMIMSVCTIITTDQIITPDQIITVMFTPTRLNTPC